MDKLNCKKKDKKIKISKQLDEKFNNIMLTAAEVIRRTCEVKTTCKGCPFNKLTNGQGEYDEEKNYTDADDREYKNYTYCELYFGEETRPQYWELENLRGEING